MKKLISWIVLAALVIIVPVGSWYYLQQGLDYRRSALKDLAVKDSIQIQDDSLMLFKGKTTLLVLGKDSSVMVHSKIIDDQYGSSFSFQTLSTSTNLGIPQVPDNYIANLIDKFSEYQYLLIDTSMKIRNHYKDSNEDLKRLVEHIAIILPRPVESDIKMK